MKSPLQSPQKSFSQPEGEHIKKDKGKKAMSLKEAEKESTNNDSNDDDETHVTGSMVEPSTTKKLKRFNFITEDGRHIHLNEEEINCQKNLEEDAKAKAAKQEGEVRKAELVDLLGLEVVNKYYNDKLQYDRYCDKMLNRRAKSRITNCDVLTKKGPITLKVYREDGTREVIPNFKASDLHLGEWREDPLDKLNDLANKKRKHADDIHDYFKANKRLKSSVQYEDHLPGSVLNEPVLDMIIRHQGPGLDDHARTFNSLLLAEVDKRNLNPLKQIRVIEQLLNTAINIICGSHLLTRGDGCPMTTCHVAADLTCTRLQVAANDWYEVAQVAANDWYEVAGGRLAGQSKDATCSGCLVVMVVEGWGMEEGFAGFSPQINPYLRVQTMDMVGFRVFWKSTRDSLVLGVSTIDAYQKFLSLMLKALTASSLARMNVNLFQSSTSKLLMINGLEMVVAMISKRMKKFYKETGRKLQFDAKDPEDSKALVTLDGEGVDWTSHSEDEQENYAFMACNSSGLDTEREQLGDASIEIQSYTQCLKKVEAQLVVINKVNFEAKKEKEDLKAKVEKWHNSSKNLNILLNSQMSARDKAGLRYGDQLNKGVLSYENEVFQSVFVSRTSETKNNPVNDRYAEGMHAVPPLMTRIYIPSGPDREIYDSQFTYGLKQSKPSEFDARSSDFNSYKSNCSKETHESMPEPVVNEPKVVSEPKVWFDAPIIEEYESNREDEHVSLPTKEQEIPSFAFINTDKHVKTPRQTVIEQNTCSQSPKPDKKDYSGLISKKLGLGFGYTKKACFVCVSFSHLIRDFDFHEKRMAKQAEINNRMLREKRKLLLSPQQIKGIADSGCSRHMTGNKAYLAEYQDFNGVAFGGSKGYITGKGKIKIGKLDFEDVCFVKELQHFNLFSVSQICDKKNKVLFTDSECLVLSPEFKLPDENQVLLRIPRQNNMYSFNLENIVPSGGLACLIAKATIDESNKWHRRLGHVNFKNLNKLVKGNLVRGLPSKIFQNDHTCVACQKGKQHKASCKAKSVSSISQPLQLLHMDLFGPTSVRSLNHKTYCLVITDDFSRFSWVFFLRTKDETSGILKDFIRQIENQLNQKVKTIRCDNGTEFKNRDFIEFCGSKGIKREYSNARTPQQNGVAERKNRTLIEAARTMLADSFLPNTFWAEAVSTACYVLNRVLVTKPQNKTPYELITGKIPIISYIRPFGCHVTILNTIDHLGKFDGKSDKGFLVGATFSPSHPTSNIEDDFSSNFLDYILASPDYVQASLGKTYFRSSNNSFGSVPIALPTLSLFHDDPYMKVMHAYYAKESPIPPPTIVPPSSMLSLIMPPKRTSTSEAPAMTQDAIRKLVVDSVTVALEA
ncbi:putative ribonuclease H-like domain-containing protein [Tanacetum coccineum]